MTSRSLALVLAACSAAPPPEPPAHHIRPEPPSRCADQLSVAAEATIELAYRVSTTTIVERTIEQHRVELQRCYQARVANDPDRRGRVYATFRVNSGQLVDVHLRGTDPVVDRCVCDVLFQLDLAHVDAGPSTYVVVVPQ